MSNIINLSGNWREVDNRVIGSSVIRPAREVADRQIANEHTSEPIKSVEHVNQISDYLISLGRYRDNMIYIVGINFGLRVSDLVSLRFSDILDETVDGRFRFKDSFSILEKKTTNTRKVKKNRFIAINDSVVDAVVLYLENSDSIYLSDYMFRSESNNGSGSNKPLDRKSVDRMLKGVAATLKLPYKVSTHTLRKTFAYHQMAMAGNDGRMLLLLQKIFGHSTSAQTLDYIGITNEEITEAYMNLNLGSKRFAINPIVEVGDYVG